MMHTTKCSKRAYGCDASYDNAWRQGTSQPHQSFSHREDSQKAKRHKNNTVTALSISDSHRSPWSPLNVPELPKATWSSRTETVTPTLGTWHPHGTYSISSNMSNFSDSSWLQGYSESSHSAESDQWQGRLQSSSWNCLKPRTESSTSRPSPSKIEPEEKEFDNNRSIESYVCPFTYTAYPEQEVSHVTGNSDSFCNLGMGNNWAGSSANDISNDTSSHQEPGHELSSDMLLGTWDSHLGLAIPDNSGYDSSHYLNKLDGRFRIPNAELASRPYHSEISEPAWHQPINSTIDDFDRSFHPTALTTTYWTPPVTNNSEYVDNNYFKQLNRYQSQRSLSTEINNELSYPTQHNNLHFAGPIFAPQEHINSGPRVLLEVSMSLVPSILQTSPPGELIDDVGANSTNLRVRIENPQGIELENQGRAKQNRKTKGRQGGLGPERAQEVRVIRKLRACFHCWARKTPCSKDEICGKCENSKWSMNPRLCTRIKLEDYHRIFFPPFLVSHLKAAKINHLSGQISRGFSKRHVKIGVSCGPHFFPMQLSVAEYTPMMNSRFETVPRVTSKNGTHVFTDQGTAPMALTEVNSELLLASCRKHAESMAAKLDDFVPSKKEGIDNVPNKLLRAISRYHGMKSPISNRRLLTQALMLYSMHYFMGRRITYSSDSIVKVNECLKRPTVNAWNSNLVSHLLNSQIKSAMQNARQKTTREILDDLEKELKKRCKKTWSTCFSVIMILCMCIEEGQIAMNGILMHKMKFAPNEAPPAERVMEVCRELDDRLFNHMTQLFHAVFKSHKYPSSTKTDNVFNPIRDGLQDEIDNSLRQDIENLVYEVQQIIHSYEHELEERAETPSYDSGDNTLANHMKFRERNSARLCAKFLLSFQAT